MPISVLRALFGSTSAGRSAPRRSIRLHLEDLETRYAPATIRVGPLDLIQPAINSAKAGDTVEISGKHREQIVITNETGHSRNNLKIVGTSSYSMIIAPTTMSKTNAIVEIRGATGVTIKCLTISGPDVGGPDSFYGILIQDGGNARIMNDHITTIADRPLSGSQRGVAIQVGSPNPGGSTGTANISDNVIDHYQKNGIQVTGNGSSARIVDNTIVGVGPTDLIAQNGIQISFGATAQICDNCIAGNVYKPDPFAGSGILLLSPGAVTIEDNSITKNDIGVFVFHSSADVLITQNYIANNQIIGIDLDTTKNARVTHNVTRRNGGGNPGVDGGIALFASTANRIEYNVSDFNKGSGIYVNADSTGNTFNRNEVKYNTIFDAEDRTSGNGTAKTANTWTNNFGRTSSPKGLLRSLSENPGCDRD